MEDSILAFGLLFVFMLLIFSKKTSNRENTSYIGPYFNKNTKTSRLNRRREQFLNLEDQIRRFKPPSNQYKT